MKLSTIILNYNTLKTTQRAVELLEKATLKIKSEIILVDNNSSEKIVKNHFKKNVSIIFNKKNYGFAKAVNQGAKISTGEYILLLNSDAFVEKNTITEMIDFMEKNTKVGIIAPKAIGRDGKIQSNFGRFTNFWTEIMKFFLLSRYFRGGIIEYDNYLNRNSYKNFREVDWVGGSCMLIRRKVFAENGGLDEHYFFGVEDLDLCYQTKKRDWKIIFYPLVKFIHYHAFSSGGSRSSFSMQQDMEGINYFWKKNYPEKILQRKIIMFLRKIKYWVVINLLNKR